MKVIIRNKAIIISILLICLYFVLSLWKNSFGFSSELSISFNSELYSYYIQHGKSANTIVKNLEELLINLPKLKNRDNIEAFINTNYRPKNDSQIVIYFEKNPPIEFHNLSFRFNMDNSLDTVIIRDVYYQGTNKATLYPIISNLINGSNQKEIIYQSWHLFWLTIVTMFGILIAFNVVEFLIKKGGFSFKSIQIYLLSILLLNLIHFTWYQQNHMNKILEEFAFASEMGPIAILSPNHLINELARNTQVFSMLFDISIVCLILLSIV